MAKRILLIFIFLFFAFLQKGACALPAFDGHILDNEGVLSVSNARDINSYLTSLMFASKKKVNILVVTVKDAPSEVVSQYVRDVTEIYRLGQPAEYGNIRTITFTVGDTPDYTIYYSKFSQFYPSDYGKFPPQIRHEFKYLLGRKSLSEAITVATYLYGYNVSGKAKFYAPLWIVAHRFPPFGYIVFIFIFVGFWLYCIWPRNRRSAAAASVGFMQPHIFHNIKKDMGYDKTVVLSRRMADLKRRNNN